MSPEAQVAAWNNIPLIIGACGVILVQILTHVSATRQRATAATAAASQLTAAVGTTSTQLVEIKEQTNGTLSKAMDRIERLEQRIEVLIQQRDTAHAAGTIEEKQRNAADKKGD